MSTPIEPKVEYLQYAWFSLLAFLGSLARWGRWTDADGKFSPQKLVTELAGAVVLGNMANAFGTYMLWKPAITGGLAGAAGLIGAAGVTTIVQNIISTRLGGKKDASSP